MFCGRETVDVSRGEAEGNIDSRGSTKHTAFPRSQSMRCDIRQNSFIELCNAYLLLGRFSFGKKFHSARNFIRQEISFGTKFHSARNFIRQEISFGKKFHSARNFIRHGTQKQKFDNRKIDIRNIQQIWRKARELTKIVGKQESNLIMCCILY